MEGGKHRQHYTLEDVITARMKKKENGPIDGAVGEKPPKGAPGGNRIRFCCYGW